MLNNTVYDTATMLGVLRDERAMQPPSNYWLSLCFPSVVTFDTEYVDFGRVTDTRKLAPLVVPTAQGVPIYSAAERMTRVKPAYVKPKDPVTATRMIRRQAGIGELTGTPLSPQARYNAIVADIIRQHRWSIERRWEWLAGQAIQFGAVTLEDENYPRTVVDFLRAANHTITLGAGNRWGDAGVSIADNVQTWVTRMRLAVFGGPATRLTIGSAVWDVMRKDTEIRAMMGLDLRPYNNGVNLNLGLREGTDVEYVGNLSSTLPVYVYSDFYQNPDGSTVAMMDPRDVVLTGSNVQGVRCFGAIQDKAAGFQSLPIFPKMWDQEDPSATFVMHQSAPLMVPVNPNNTLRARVLA